jgi:sugar phosphate isomerase/epimerase
VTFEDALKLAGASMPVVNSGRILAQGMALLHQDPTTRRRALTGFKRMLDFAGHFRSRVHLGIARGGAIPGASQAAMDGMADDLFRDLTAHAERVGATILLEPAEGGTAYIQTMQEVLAWVERIHSSVFRAMLDTHQLVKVEQSIEAGIRAARGQAEHIHLYDPSRRPPGLGSGEAALDWPHIAGILREEGFQGSGSVVIAAEGDPEAGARASARYLRRLFNQ